MNKIEREDIYIISRHSNLTEEEISEVLKEDIFSDRSAWEKFLRLFFMVLGIGFTVAGIVFFFAYNWADLHKFVKIGLAEGLIIVTTVLVLIPGIPISVRNIILTGAAVLVGVLFAVFGQIYQTGADAYDFFLAWTVFITLWVLVANYAPLWLLYLLLINTTVLMYADQVAKDWNGVLVCTLLFIVNGMALLISVLQSRFIKNVIVPQWFSNTVALAAATFATAGIVFWIFEEPHRPFPWLLLLTAAAYFFGIRYGLKAKSGFYLSLIPFSLIIIVSGLLIHISDGEMMYLTVSGFIVISVTLVIKKLIDLQKKWTNEK
ncbi:DUF2157 domain-containing protein [Sphingobacterium spiritivorum]|uniref:DUF2157 domain-containing protein n=1 Tax=Sphingobacterium spiritivorum TaxID=258 RepID=UPI003DA60B38